MQDSINKIRRYDIDLLKFIACVMVVILHGIEPGGGGYTTDNIFAGEFWNSIVFCG